MVVISSRNLQERFGKSGVLVQSSLLKHQSSRLDDMYLAYPVAWIDGPVDWM